MFVFELLLFIEPLEHFVLQIVPLASGFQGVLSSHCDWNSIVHSFALLGKRIYLLAMCVCLLPNLLNV